MRKLESRRMHALSCVLVAVAAIGCRPLSPPGESPFPAPAPADPHTRTASDAALHRGDGNSQQTYTHIEELIEGRASGVQVTRRTDGSFALRIRGLSSPASANEPLIVLDGAALELRGGEGLSGINPQDVVKIDVLKDAASTAFYGMRGGNGVIVITTRQE